MIEKMKRNNPKQQACNYSMLSYQTPTLNAPSGKFRRSNKLFNEKAAKIIYPVHHIKPE